LERSCILDTSSSKRNLDAFVILFIGTPLLYAART
jgi:hypothetical protein